MFDFSILITTEIAISIFYFTLYISLKKEIDDLSSTSVNSSENYLKINIRKRKITFLNVITVSLTLFIIILYFLPNIIALFKKEELTNFFAIMLSNIGNFLLKFTPFRKGFLSNSNFKFSYITETILSIILVVLIVFALQLITNKTNIISNLLILLTLEFIFIWINNFISLLLVRFVTNCFPLLSIILNFFIYMLPIIIIIRYFIYKRDEYYSNFIDTESDDQSEL